MSIKLRAARLWNRCPALVLSPSCYQERADGRTVVGAPMNTLPKLCKTFHDRTDASQPAARFLLSNPATVQNVSLLTMHPCSVLVLAYWPRPAVAAFLPSYSVPDPDPFLRSLAPGRSVSSDCVESPGNLLAALWVAFASRCR